MLRLFFSRHFPLSPFCNRPGCNFAREKAIHSLVITSSRTYLSLILADVKNCCLRVLCHVCRYASIWNVSHFSQASSEVCLSSILESSQLPYLSIAFPSPFPLRVFIKYLCLLYSLSLTDLIFRCVSFELHSVWFPLIYISYTYCSFQKIPLVPGLSSKILFLICLGLTLSLLPLSSSQFYAGFW